MGCKSIRVQTIEELPLIINEFFKYDGLILLDVIVDKDEHVYPMVSTGKALHEMDLGHLKLNE